MYSAERLTDYFFVLLFVCAVFTSELLFVGCTCIWRPQGDVECLLLLLPLDLGLTSRASLNGQWPSATSCL